MQPISNRAIVIVSGLLTLIVLSAASLGVAVHNGWIQVSTRAERSRHQGVAPSMQASAAAVAPASPTAIEPRLPAQVGPTAGGQDEAAQYRRKLDEAYRALDEAYGQIRALQAAQAGPAADGRAMRAVAQRGEEREHGERERGERRRGGREGNHE